MAIGLFQKALFSGLIVAAMPKRQSANVEYELKPRASTKKPKAQADIVPDPNGWQVSPPSIIYKDWGAAGCKKIAAFDLDGTLVNTKSNSQFPRTAEDWKLYNKGVPKVIKAFADDGYKVVIFSNQGGIKSALSGAMAQKTKARIDQVVAKLEVMPQAFLATLDDDNRKPNTGLWKFMVEMCNGSISPDLKKSFFVGDAAGRPTDFSDSDREFAKAIGIPFKTPEDVFGEMDGKRAMDMSSKAAAGPCVNPELADIFNRLANAFAGDRFKGSAFLKVAKVLEHFPTKVTRDNLKELGKMPGVGKGSLGLIKEFLEDGRVRVLEEMEGGGAGGEDAGEAVAAPASGQAAPKKPVPNKAADMASKFM